MVDVTTTFLYVKWLMLMPLVADGMPLKFMSLMLLPLDFWLMLLPKLCDVADVITTWQMLLPIGWRFGRCYSQCGRCYSQRVCNLF